MEEVFIIEKTKKSFYTRKKRLRKRFSSLKKYYDYDDTEYRRIRDIGNLFNGNLFNGLALNEIDEGYCKPTKTKRTLNSNYTKYESKGVKDKNLFPKEYLNLIRMTNQK